MPQSSQWIEKLMPQGGEIFLDHVGFFSQSLDDSAAQLEKLGFEVSPVNVHYGADENGNLVPTGTSNRIVVLGMGYLEVLAGTGSTPLAQELSRALSLYQGLHLIGFTHSDMPAQRNRLIEAGFPMQEIIELRRLVQTPEGEKQLAISVLRTQPGHMAEGRIQMLTNHTPELIWKPGTGVHPNHAEALTEILIVVEEPKREMERYQHFTDRQGAEEGGLDSITLDRGRLVFASPEQAKQMIPGLELPRIPFIAGVAIRSGDLQKTMAFLVGSSIHASSQTDDLVCIDRVDALGAYLLFHSKSIQAPWHQLSCS